MGTPNGVCDLYDTSPHYSVNRRLILNRISRVLGGQIIQDQLTNIHPIR